MFLKLNEKMYQSDLINHLIKEKIIKHKEIADVMTEIKREYFVRESDKYYAYCDCPMPIGNGQTISAPHMVKNILFISMLML